MLDEGQVAEGVTVLVLAEMQHLAPKKKHISIPVLLLPQRWREQQNRCKHENMEVKIGLKPHKQNA